jgi:8-hydroxy-5-deazaflavin:NADPH oxidoreductase
MPEDLIGIIGGTGDLGLGLALRWAQAGRQVLLGSRVASRAQEKAQGIRAQLGGEARVTGLTNEEVVARAPLAALTVPFDAQMATLASVREHFQQGQVLVDCTVPLEATVGGAASRMLGVWAGSAAQQAARAVPKGVAMAAAFHNVSAHALQQLEQAVDCDVLVCADAEETRARVRPWVEAIHGCRYIDGGRLENARIVESITALLIGINRRYKTASGIRITGIDSAQ